MGILHRNFIILPSMYMSSWNRTTLLLECPHSPWCSSLDHVVRAMGAREYSCRTYAFKFVVLWSILGTHFTSEPGMCSHSRSVSLALSCSLSLSPYLPPSLSPFLPRTKFSEKYGWGDSEIFNLSHPISSQFILLFLIKRSTKSHLWVNCYPLMIQDTHWTCLLWRLPTWKLLKQLIPCLPAWIYPPNFLFLLYNSPLSLSQKAQQNFH